MVLLINKEDEAAGTNILHVDIWHLNSKSCFVVCGRLVKSAGAAPLKPT